ncbi:epidermal patterning factor-like protein 1 [Quercus suber]|uniref:Epidermal patterning factor-like protein n=1 Tax=Quercus suber TaxID=58331 RepID=A0AAW0MBF5_QUESU
MTMMNSLNSYLLCTTTSLVIIIMVLYNNLSPVSCFNQQQQPPNSHRGLLFEEKNRLGSTPPSCHNKCNKCHPCMAVQVPTMPSRLPVQPGLTRLARTTPMEFFDPSAQTNYKPLGWKCSCQNNLFNP